MHINVVHIDECPNWKDAGALLTEILSELGIREAGPTYTLVRTPEEAAAASFAGSPTILIDGVDAFEDAVPTTDLACRVYRDGQRMVGLPSRESLHRAIVAARDAESPTISKAHQ